MLTQIIDKLFFHSSVIYPWSLQLMIMIIMFAIGMGWLAIIIKKSMFLGKQIKKPILIILICLTLCFFVINLNFNSFRAADEEWGSIYRAKTILGGNKVTYSNEHTGIVFPIIMAGLLKVSNFNYPAIRIFNILLGSLSLWLIFGCSRTLFDNDTAGLFSVIIYILTPWSYRYTGVLFGLPTLVHFLSLLCLLTILLAFKYHELSLHLLALSSLMVLNQTKMEYFFYYLIYLIIFCIVKEWKNFSKKQIVLFSIIAVMLLIPPIIKANLFKISFSRNPGWCGFPSQTTNDVYANNSFVLLVNKLLKPLVNTRISLSYFLGDLPVFVKFWSQNDLILPVLLAIIGIFLISGDYTHKKLQFFLPIIFFASLALGYCFDCGWYEARHAISAYGFLVIYAGYCLYWFWAMGQQKQAIIKFLSKGLIIYLLTFQMCICICSLNNYRSEITSFPSWFNSYAIDSRLLSGFTDKQSLIVTLSNTDRNILLCLGYKAISVTDFINSNTQLTNAQLSADTILNSSDIKNEPKVYFLKSFDCDNNNIFKNICQLVVQKRSRIEKELYLPNESYMIQLLVLRNKIINGTTE
ncbi:MAG TPA: glycosyltransferase family 39 protein [Candidatus Paceibacterota bacterium]|nr:glycosyltransferase family 39 protein [Candidatus Paceibacterota bacterium]HPR91146.1 glycosyltransferase family 39 protein [Candidatus Paceibacterota bacterium]